MNSQIFKGLLAGAFFISIFAQAAPKRGQPAASEHLAYHYVTLFKKSASDLTQADKDALMRVLQTIKDRSQKIEQVHVAAWSDKELSNRELATKRANALQDYFEGPLAQSFVETYNMAERSNWFSRAMGASEKDIKKIFAQKGAPQNVTPKDFAIVKSKGGPGTAVVLIELEPETSMPSDQ